MKTNDIFEKSVTSFTSIGQWMPNCLIVRFEDYCTFFIKNTHNLKRSAIEIDGKKCPRYLH